jgi:hypothetical protein
LLALSSGYRRPTGSSLAGGGALLASGLTDRLTHDLDSFGAPDDVDVSAARDQFEVAIAERGWQSERLHDSATFVRVHITGAEELIVEFAIDSPAGQPPVVSIVGPGKRADGAGTGRVTRSTSHHSRSTTGTRKPALTRSATL